MKVSFSGFFATSPAAFIALNTGLSESLRRIHSEIASRRSENTKGTRQPQASHASCPTIHCVVRTTTRLRMKPPATLAWMKLVKKPRLRVLACSAT